MGVATVTLGNHRGIPVVPQRHARLRRHLTPEAFQRIMSREYGMESYRTLCILIPAIDPASKMNIAAGGGGIPLWEWEGYSSQEAMDNDQYDDDLDASPTTAEMVNAFETVLMVAGAGRLGKIMTLAETLGNLTPTQTAPSPGLPGSSGE